MICLIFVVLFCGEVLVLYLNLYFIVIIYRSLLVLGFKFYILRNGGYGEDLGVDGNIELLELYKFGIFCIVSIFVNFCRW